MVIEVTDGLACWVKYVAGNITGGPKARVAVFRAVMARMEAVARDAGCTEIKLCGRDWSRILPDYSPCEGRLNCIRKGL